MEPAEDPITRARRTFATSRVRVVVAAAVVRAHLRQALAEARVLVARGVIRPPR